jgi:hypothetical protein
MGSSSFLLFSVSYALKRRFFITGFLTFFCPLFPGTFLCLETADFYNGEFRFFLLLFPGILLCLKRRLFIAAPGAFFRGRLFSFL